jgi:hypothetical protein
MSENDALPYSTHPREGAFDVLYENDNIVLTCQTQANADEYAALLNEAYRRGFKAGYRHARKQ